MFVQLADSPKDLVRGTAQVGAAHITVCSDGTCRFDGGAMFGVVPRTLWQKKAEPDEQNRVAIGLNCFLVKIGGKTVLIETGFGNKIAPKLKSIYATEERLPLSLAAAGIAPEEIDIVINSHLHWDHCGWNTILEDAGRPVPYFPNATYYAHRGEVEHGRQQWERDRVSYMADNYEPLLRDGRMHLVDPRGQGERVTVCPGVTLECFPGHTAQTMAVHIESEGETACFVSDLVPTTAHLDLTWVMAFDLDPMRTIAERRRFYQSAVSENWLVLFPHDHITPMARITKDEAGRVVLA